MPASAQKLQIPRWMQLVGLPLVLLFLWTLASTVAHVVFLFIVAALIALLLDPVRAPDGCESPGLLRRRGVLELRDCVGRRRDRHWRRGRRPVS
jgi:hypothetical protein